MTKYIKYECKIPTRIYFQFSRDILTLYVYLHIYGNILEYTYVYLYKNILSEMKMSFYLGLNNNLS